MGFSERFADGNVLSSTVNFDREGIETSRVNKILLTHAAFSSLFGTRHSDPTIRGTQATLSEIGALGVSQGIARYRLNDADSDLGSMLGHALNKNDLSPMPTDSLGGKMAKNLGNMLDDDLSKSAISLLRKDGIYNSLAPALVSEIETFDDSTLGALLGYELVEADRFSLTQSLVINISAQAVVNSGTILDNIRELKGDGWLKGLATFIGNRIPGVIGGFIGTHLGEQFYRAGTRIGHITGIITSVVFTALLTSATSNPFIVKVVNSYFGSIWGTIIGGWLGDFASRLFGIKPKAHHTIAFNGAIGAYETISERAKNGGSAAIASTVADVMRKTLNNIIDLVDARRVTGTGNTTINVLQWKKSFWIDDFSPHQRNHDFNPHISSTITSAVEEVLDNAVHKLQFAGGNIVKRRAFEYARINDQSLNSLLGILHIAGESLQELCHLIHRY